jgi:elongation factor G
VVFSDETVGGVVPKAFVPGVEKGVRSACERGVQDGWPLVDVVVRLVDGAFHVKDSSSLAFEIAASCAVLDGARRAGIVRLEPIMAAELAVPEIHVGDAISEVSSRRGSVTRVGTGTVEARVPLAASFGLISSLRSRTHGRGTVSMQPAGYEPAPA